MALSKILGFLGTYSLGEIFTFTNRIGKGYICLSRYSMGAIKFGQIHYSFIDTFQVLNELSCMRSGTIPLVFVAGFKYKGI